MDAKSYVIQFCVVRKRGQRCKGCQEELGQNLEIVRQGADSFHLKCYIQKLRLIGTKCAETLKLVEEHYAQSYSDSST